MAQRRLEYYELPTAQLPSSKLPTVQQVLSHSKCLKEEEGKNLKLTQYLGRVAEHVLQLWARCNIPVITKRACVGRLNKWLIDFEKWRKGTVTNRINVSGRQILSDHGFFQLFNIAKCGHGLGHQVEPCRCRETDRIPSEMHSFYIDQSSTRSMDLEESAPNEIEQEFPVEVADSPSHEHEAYAAGPSTSTATLRYGRQIKHIAASGVLSPGSTSSRISTATLKDANYYQPESGEESEDSDTEVRIEGRHEYEARSIIRKLKFKHFSLSLDRFGVTNVAASHIATALLIDLSLVSEGDTKMVIDQQKIKRCRDAMREIVDKQWAHETKIQSIFFDGKKGDSLVPDPDFQPSISSGIGQPKPRPKYVVRPVENITILSQPGNHFLGFVSPDNGTGSAVCKAVTDYMNASKYDWKDIIAIGTDGAGTNTGRENGAIARIERGLGRPVHWLICMFHLNEKCLARVLKVLGCDTSSNDTYIGPLGSLLSDAHRGVLLRDFPAIKLQNMPAIMPAVSELTSDQKYLLEAAEAVSRGKVSSKFDGRSPGKLNNARWLTKANRILRLYMKTRNPPDALCTAVKYLQLVFIPMWFGIKMNPTFFNGSRHFFNFIQFSKSITDRQVTSAVEECLLYNFYYGFSEQIIIGMLTDEDAGVRTRGYEIIERIRKEVADSTDNVVREVKRQSKAFYNFNADRYYDLIDLDGENVFEPPSTMHFTDEDIENLKNAKAVPILPNIPCHSQAVEFYVQEVHRVAPLAKPERRLNMVRCTALARRLNPYFKTKSKCIVKDVHWDKINEYMCWDI